MPISLDGSGSISGISTFSFSDEIIHTGDTNTAIKFPANDTITFETDGSERLRIGSNGYVNIGTGTAQQQLTVQNSAQHSLVRVISSPTAESGIDFGDTDDGDQGKVRYNNVDSYMRFDVSASEKLRIDSSGRVMIGTTNEGEANADDLTIATTGHTGITLRSGTSNYGQIFFSDAESGTGEYEGIIAYDHSNNSMVFHTTRAERLRIASDGKVGIGTNNPTTNLQVNHATNECTISLFNGGTKKAALQTQNSFGTILYSYDSEPLKFSVASGTSYSEKLRITSSNIISKSTVDHVLLGTDTARTVNNHAPRLQVTGTTYSHATVSIINNSTGADGAYLFLGKQKSGAIGGSSAVSEHDIIGELRFNAGDGTDMENLAARIKVHADANATSNNTPGYMEFYTTRRNGSSHRKIRIGQNTNHGTQFSFGAENDLNNTSTPDRTSLKVGPATHIEGVFGHNGTPGMYYNCYSGGNENFYRGTRAPSGGDWRPCAYGQKYGQHYFYGDNSSTAWSAQQQITSMQTNMYITSHGYVRKQYQPAFDAVRTAGTVPDGANQRIVFNSTLTNVGNHYNTSNGYFTAPTVGTYLFSFFGMNNNTLAWYNFRKNNSIINPQHGTYQTNGTDWSSVGMTIVIVLAANDTMSVYTGNSNAIGMYGQGNNHNGFCGYMLG